MNTIAMPIRAGLCITATQSKRRTVHQPIRPSLPFIHVERKRRTQTKPLPVPLRDAREVARDQIVQLAHEEAVLRFLLCGRRPNVAVAGGLVGVLAGRLGLDADTERVLEKELGDDRLRMHAHPVL